MNCATFSRACSYMAVASSAKYAHRMDISIIDAIKSIHRFEHGARLLRGAVESDTPAGYPGALPGSGWENLGGGNLHQGS